MSCTYLSAGKCLTKCKRAVSQRRARALAVMWRMRSCMILGRHKPRHRTRSAFFHLLIYTLVFSCGCMDAFPFPLRWFICGLVLLCSDIFILPYLCCISCICRRYAWHDVASRIGRIRVWVLVWMDLFPDVYFVSAGNGRAAVSQAGAHAGPGKCEGASATVWLAVRGQLAGCRTALVQSGACAYTPELCVSGQGTMMFDGYVR